MRTRVARPEPFFPVRVLYSAIFEKRQGALATKAPAGNQPAGRFLQGRSTPSTAPPCRWTGRRNGGCSGFRRSNEALLTQVFHTPPAPAAGVFCLRDDESPKRPWRCESGLTSSTGRGIMIGEGNGRRHRRHIGFMGAGRRRRALT